jgi:hypothetical protein
MMPVYALDWKFQARLPEAVPPTVKQTFENDEPVNSIPIASQTYLEEDR